MLGLSSCIIAAEMCFYVCACVKDCECVCVDVSDAFSWSELMENISRWKRSGVCMKYLCTLGLVDAHVHTK